MSVKIRLIGFVTIGVSVAMAGWGGLGGYLEDLQDRRQKAGDPNDTSPAANLTRKACDWVARKGFGPAAAPQAHFACGPYWDNAPYEPPKNPQPPFEGGQCDGVQYTIAFNWEECGVPKANTIGPVLGPITFNGVESINDDDGSCNGETMQRWRWSASPKFGGANQVFTNVDGSIDVQVSRVDGLPDDCGSPPAPERDPVDLPPGTLPPDGSPVDISDPNDPNDTTPPVVFAPNPPPEYGPFVPFVPQFPGQPPFAFPPGPGDDIPPRVGEPVDVPPGGTGDDDIDTPDDDIPDECIGYSWEFYDVPLARGDIPGSTPRRFYEIFGSAQLRVSSRDAGLYDIPVKIDSARGVCYRSDTNLRVRGLSLNSKTSFGPVRVRPVYVVVRES